jgi:hypothetical protein
MYLCMAAYQAELHVLHTGRTSATRRNEVNTQKGQTRKMDAAIAALLTSPTIADAAKQCGVSRRTMQHWIKRESFRKQYAAAKRELLDSTINRLRTIGNEAATALQRVIADKETPASTTVSASRAVIEILLKNHEIEVLEARIEKLENERDV